MQPDALKRLYFRILYSMIMMVAIIVFIALSPPEFPFKLIFWFWIAGLLDTFLDRNDRGRRLRKKLKAATAKFKKFDPRPLARPLPVPA